MVSFGIMPTGDIAPEPGSRILKAEEYAALVEAGELVDEARKVAAAMLVRAEEEVKESHRKGYEEGLREGKDEAAEKLFEMVEASVEQLSTMEASLVDVVVKSVRTILGSFDREELAVKTIGHALRLVQDEKRITLRVAAGDAEMVRDRLDNIIRNYPGMGRITVLADPALALGGCIMETDIGVIDATLERQIKIIEDTFRRHLEERDR